jgi:hypothetical protein
MKSASELRQITEQSIDHESVDFQLKALLKKCADEARNGKTETTCSVTWYTFDPSQTKHHYLAYIVDLNGYNIDRAESQLLLEKVKALGYTIERCHGAAGVYFKILW